MRKRQQRWIDYTGLNLIRIVIGSYFMAIALGLISGISPPVLFLPFTDPTTADLIGTVLLFSVTASFMLGLYLRLTSLILAIFVFSSSLAQNFVRPETALIEPFWRDLTLVCAILLSYTCLKRTELSRAALVWRRSTPRLSSDQTVTPRRIVTAGVGAERIPSEASYRTMMKPLIQTPPSQPNPPKGTVLSTTAKREEPEIDNIFATF